LFGLGLPVRTLIACWNTPRDVVQYRYLCTSDSEQTARLCREAYGIYAGCDNRNTLILRGPPEAVEDALKTIDRLESMCIDGPLEVVFVRNLTHAKAAEIAALLNAMGKAGFFPRDRLANRDMPILAALADERTNAVVVEVHKQHEDRVRSVIEELDKPLDRK
jgi:type II secretory pathway component GspD/PulD (secretin)